ncbi:MAG: hypothetical protein LBJ69_03785 [Holosporales bacterium]|jgi:hypothetical protein|nr:hypothetical protein [Holosporales bacterium]
MPGINRKITLIAAAILIVPYASGSRGMPPRGSEAALVEQTIAEAFSHEGAPQRTVVNYFARDLYATHGKQSGLKKLQWFRSMDSPDYPISRIAFRSVTIMAFQLYCHLHGITNPTIQWITAEYVTRRDSLPLRRHRKQRRVIIQSILTQSGMSQPGGLLGDAGPDPGIIPRITARGDDQPPALPPDDQSYDLGMDPDDHQYEKSNEFNLTWD